MVPRISYFFERRPTWYGDLAEVVAVGGERVDSEHPAFHGWWDWHSAVHGTLAHLLLHQMKSPKFLRYIGWVTHGLSPKDHLQEVDAILRPERIGREYAEVLAGKIAHELPYGYAWFLKLAKEHHDETGSLLLVDLANYMAGEILHYAAELPDEAFRQGLASQEYKNLSWPLFNVLEWVQYTGDQERYDRLAQLIETRVLPNHDAAVEGSSGKIYGFFDPANLLAMLCCALETEEALQTLGRLQPVLDRPPLREFPTVHSAGMNFSRCWGHWWVFQMARDEASFERYFDHLEAHLDVLTEQCADYARYGHWIGQFGVYAVSLMIPGSLQFGRLERGRREI